MEIVRCRRRDVKKDIRVTGSLNKVEAGMNAVIHNLLTIDAILLLQVRIKARLDVVEDGSPTAVCQEGICGCKIIVPVVVVDKVAKTGGIDDCQVKTDTVLFNVYGEELSWRRREKESEHTCPDALDSDSLWVLCRGRKRLLGGVKRSVEERVNERGLSEARLALWE